MKNIIVITLMLFMASLTNAQSIERSIENELYTVYYSEAYQQPINIKYSYPEYSTKYSLRPLLLPEGINYPNVKCSEYEWKTPTGILTSDNKDYENNDYDKGHLVPNSFFNEDEENLNFLFSYLNCGLMHKTLNQGLWRELEKYERSLYYDDNNVRVKVMLTFSSDSKVVDGGATVPTYFTKIIEYGFPTFYIKSKGMTFKREVYSFPNDASVKGKKIDAFKIESQSGEFTLYDYQEYE